MKLERNTNSSTTTLKGKLERTEHRLKLERVRSSNKVMRMLDKMASQGRRRRIRRSTCYRFLLRNLKSRGPSSVQAKGFRAEIITILFANVELHREKNKNKNKKKTKLAI